LAIAKSQTQYNKNKKYICRRHLQKSGISGNARKPPVRKNIELPPGMGGIKVRLG